MSESFSVNIVNGLDQLFGIISDDSLIEGARIGNVVKQLSAMDKFADNVSNGDLLAAFLVPDGILVEFEILYDVFVVESLHRLNFVAQKLERSGIEIRVIESEDLDGIFGSVGSCT